MKDLLEDSRLCLTRAKEHIVDLDRQIVTFLHGTTGTRVTEPDPNGIHKITKIKFSQQIPGKIKAIASDAANNLRNALDLAGHGIAYSLGKGSIPKHTHFPFGDSKDGLEIVIKGTCKSLPQEIVTLYRTFKPYKGGNDLLWAINKLANTNKHKILVPIGFAIGGVAIKRMKFSGSVYQMQIPPVWDSIKNEIVIGVFGADTDVEYDMQIQFDIAFDEVEVVRRKPAVGVLNTQASIVEAILLAIETESRRLGFIT